MCVCEPRAHNLPIFSLNGVKERVSCTHCSKQPFLSKKITILFRMKYSRIFPNFGEKIQINFKQSFVKSLDKK